MTSSATESFNRRGFVSTNQSQSSYISSSTSSSSQTAFTYNIPPDAPRSMKALDQARHRLRHLDTSLRSLQSRIENFAPTTTAKHFVGDVNLATNSAAAPANSAPSGNIATSIPNAAASAHGVIEGQVSDVGSGQTNNPSACPLPDWASLFRTVQLVTAPLQSLIVHIVAHTADASQSGYIGDASQRDVESLFGEVDMETDGEHIPSFGSLHAYPLPTFPGATQETILTQLLRKKLEPGVEDWQTQGLSNVTKATTGFTYKSRDASCNGGVGTGAEADQMNVAIFYEELWHWAKKSTRHIARQVFLNGDDDNENHQLDNGNEDEDDNCYMRDGVANLSGMSDMEYILSTINTEGDEVEEFNDLSRGKGRSATFKTQSQSQSQSQSRPRPQRRQRNDKRGATPHVPSVNAYMEFLYTGNSSGFVDVVNANENVNDEDTVSDNDYTVKEAEKLGVTVPGA